MTEFLQNLTGSRVLVTFIVSMLPVVELRGAIPVGVSMGMSPMGALAAAWLGSTLPAPFIILFIRKIFHWAKRVIPSLDRFIRRVEDRAMSRRGFIDRWEIWGLVIFVGIPLPGTGIWTGALLAALMEIRMKRALPALALGNAAAGVMITALTYGIAGLF